MGWDGTGWGEPGWDRVGKDGRGSGWDGDEGRIELRWGVGVGAQLGGMLAAAAISGKIEAGAGFLIEGGVVWGRCCVV